MTKNLTRTIYLAVISLLTCISMQGQGQQRVFYSFDASYGLADNSAQTVKCTKTGRMVITTIGHVNFYDGGSFTHIDPREEDAFPLPAYSGHYHLYFDKHHHLWLKDKRKVTCVDLLTERFVADVDAVIREQGMQQTVEDMFGDHENRLWFMSGRKLYGPELGCEVPVRCESSLQDVDVYDGHLLLQFFGNGMVSAYDIAKKSHVYDVAAFAGQDSARYDQSSVICLNGDVYYQIRNGEKESILLSFDMKTRQWQQLMQLPYHMNNMDIYDGCIYVASEYGYWTYNLNTQERHHEEMLTLAGGRKLLTDINTVAFDRHGGMWIGTEKRGLLYSRPFNSPFTAYTWDRPEAIRYAQMMDGLPAILHPEPLPRHVNCKYRDSRGWQWTGSYTGLQLERPGQETYVYTRKDGLLNEMIHSVIEDDNHDIWIGTSYGISHLFIKDGQVGRIETYNDKDNVPNESFVNARAMKLADGTIVMQSLDHVVAFNPKDFHVDSLGHLKFYPKLIRMLVNGRDVKAGMEVDGRVILERAITRTRELSVNYYQNSLSLTFSGLNYLRPVQTYYRFRVKGIYDEWQTLSYYNSDGQVDSRGLLHLPLVGLRPGKYEIELQASMSPDEWPQEPYVWIINVEEPWWRTTGLYVSLGVLLLGLLIANFVFYNRNLRLRLRRNNEENDILHRIKTFAERCETLSDEILTPYSSIDDKRAVMDEDFADAMSKIVPYVLDRKQKGQSFNMRQLADETGIMSAQLYALLSAHLYESPRLLTLRLRLQKAATLLRETKLSKEDIAGQCGFVSPNYFIASFYHQYRMTPDDYRSSMPL